MKLLFMLFLLSVASIFTLRPNNSYVYPQTAQITKLNYKTDTVTITTATGISYTFIGIEDYTIGDLVSVIMDSNHTKDYIPDDKVLKVQYSGYNVNRRVHQ